MSFSGGRDSSIVLAAAVGAARRHGLAPPVPATIRFPGIPATEESAWQEEVVRFLGVADWLRIEMDAELDLVGPVARGALRRHGLLFPAQAYFHLPLMEIAGGGSLLTGAAGNDLLAPGRWGLAVAPLAERRRPRRADLRGLAYAALPGAATACPPIPWLTPQGRAELDRARAADPAEPLSWTARTGWMRRRRWLASMRWSLATLGAGVGVEVAHPLAGDSFLAAVARDRRRRGPATRTGLLLELFGGRVPEAVLRRTHRTNFTEAYWGPLTREFVASWSGGGVDTTLVDPEAVGAVWRHGAPQLATALLVQSAWLALARGAQLGS